jgi:hypothetical protein
MSARTPQLDPAAEARRNFRLGVVNGALYQAGDGFVDATTVLPVFLSRLTSSSALIGFASSLPDLGWFLPQFAMVPWIARLPRHLPVYRRAAVVRGAALGLLAALIVPLDRTPGTLLAVFLACYTLYCFGAGFAGVSWLEVVGKTVPGERLPSYFAQRLFWGGLLVAAAGLVVRQVLRAHPGGVQFAALFGVATVLVSVAYALFGAIREPAGPPDRAASTPLGMLRHGVTLLRGDPTFRRLLIARAALSVWAASSPFMVLFAVHDLGGGTRAVGTFLFARMAGAVLSNLAWKTLAERRGPQFVMRVTTLGCGVLGLGAAVTAALSPWGLGWIATGHAVLLLEALSFASGTVQSGITLAYASLVIQLAPQGGRQSFMGLMNTFLGSTLFLPALGGALVDALNAPAVFALCALGAIPCHLAACRLPAGRAPAAPPAAGLERASGGGAGR